MKKILGIVLFCATTLLAANDGGKLVEQVEVLSDTSFQYRTSDGTWMVVTSGDHFSYKEVDMNYALVLSAISNTIEIRSTYDSDKTHPAEDHKYVEKLILKKH